MRRLSLVHRKLDLWGNDLARSYHEAMMPIWRWQATRKRRRWVANYIAVVGSCGKSTTTMLTGRIFADQSRTVTGLFHNNERPCLRVVRHLKGPTEHIVQEISEFPKGMLGHIVEHLQPDCAIVTSVGLDHYTAFRTEAAVAAEIASLTSQCRLLCLNADDPHAVALASGSTARIVRFGTGADADVRAEAISSGLPGRLTFDLVVGDIRRRVKTRFLGRLMLTNALGALACAYAHGLDLDRAIATLGAIEPAHGRMSVHTARNGSTVVLDTVKAPLWSARRLVDDLRNMAAGSRIFLLGGISDTGSGSSTSRYRQLLTAAAQNCDLVIGFGEAQSSAARLADRLGPNRIVATANLQDALRILKDRQADLLVVKGNALQVQDKAFLSGLDAMSGTASASGTSRP